MACRRAMVNPCTFRLYSSPQRDDPSWWRSSWCRVRVLAINMYLPFNSIPRYDLPNRFATTAVVPEPMNGSRTTPGSSRALHRHFQVTARRGFEAASFPVDPFTSCGDGWSDGISLCGVWAFTLPGCTNGLGGGVNLGVPHREQACGGQPARIGLSQSRSGKTAKWAP